jgi:peptide/nickel transport system ATP-binding protein
MSMEKDDLILQVRQLKVSMPTFEGTAKILQGVDLEVKRRDVLGLVGETGCGKTMTALAVTRLLRSPPARISAEHILFKGEDLLRKPSGEIRDLRARCIGMVFQDPMTNLNPVLSIGEQITDAVVCRQGHGSNLSLSPVGRLLPAVRRQRRQAEDAAKRMLRRVGIGDVDRRLHSYPHEFSGGMRQRTLIAMALAGKPELLIADEPTTGLDVSVQSQIIQLVRDLVRDMELSVVWITHDLGVVWKLCTEVAVMYAGAIVERCPVEDLFEAPRHPYTVGLIGALPTRQKNEGRLVSIPGSLPSLIDPPSGCRFHPRCPKAMPRCTKEEPRVSYVNPRHTVACHLFDRSR